MKIGVHPTRAGLGLPNQKAARAFFSLVMKWIIQLPWYVSARLSAFVKEMQIGRMESVLHQRTDAQLRQIGITRKEIPQHARFLITYEYDGL